MKRYALCDADTLKKHHCSLSQFIDLCHKHRIDMVQYRNKNDDFETIKSDLLTLRKIWDSYLIINDYIDLLPFCDGLHLGQEDLNRYGASSDVAVKNVRKEIGNDKIFGLSTHNEKEILEANRLDLNYIGLGAYRATRTKDVDTILGDKLDALATLSTHPVAAIGGIRFDDQFEHVTYLVVGTALYED